MDWIYNKNNQIIAAAILVFILLFVFRGHLMAMGKRTFRKDNSSGGSNDKSKVLKKGDSGNLVKLLQEMILDKSSNSLPRYGADGTFGNETELALVNLTGRKSISISDFEKAIRSTSTKIDEVVGEVS